jgi:hypothetical protein
MLLISFSFPFLIFSFVACEFIGHLRAPMWKPRNLMVLSLTTTSQGQRRLLVHRDILQQAATDGGK